MSQPREPIGPLLQQAASEEELQRIWRGVQRQRARKPARWAPLLLAMAVLSSLVFAGVASWWPAAGNEDALRDETGRAASLFEGGLPRTTRLSDGSHIELAADSALEVLENDADSFVCALRRGRATFDVVPGAHRRWKIEAGAVTVEVVGTRFQLDRRESGVIVEVERGAVLVRGENVRDGVQKLKAGARLEIINAPPLNAATPAASAAPVAAPATSSKPAATGEPGAETSGAASARAASTDWLTLADQQRRRGDVQGAIQTLRLAVERAPDDTRAAMAAFTLGKLLLDGVGRPVDAQAAFRTCLTRSPPSAIAEDALARLVEAQSRSGAREAALATAREYERRYPNGRRLSDVRRWTSAR